MAKKQASIIPEGGTHFSNHLSAYVAAIIKELEQLQSAGVNPSEIFDDWLESCYHTLLMMPAHAQAIAETGKMAVDPPEVQKHFTRINGRYCERNQSNWAHINRAFSYLLDSVHEDMDQSDVLGEVYMQFAYPNLRNGQFFTPWSVCRVMAEMTIGENGGGRDVVLRHIQQTIKEAESCPTVFLIEAALMTSVLLNDPEDDPNHALDFFLKHVVTPTVSLPNWKPLGVHDPAVGSGRCLIAASKCFPAWANYMGLVQYFGQDIDHTCVQMAHINMILHGLNLHWLKSYQPIAHLVPSAQEAISRHQEKGLDDFEGIEVIEAPATIAPIIQTAVEVGDREGVALAAKAWRDQVAVEAADSQNIYQLNMFGEGMTQAKRKGKR